MLGSPSPGASIWFENWGCLGYSLKTEGVEGPKISTECIGMVELRASFLTFLFNYMQIFLPSEDNTFGKFSHLKFLYVIGHDNFS